MRGWARMLREVSATLTVLLCLTLCVSPNPREVSITRNLLTALAVQADWSKQRFLSLFTLGERQQRYIRSLKCHAISAVNEKRLTIE